MDCSASPLFDQRSRITRVVLIMFYYPGILPEGLGQPVAGKTMNRAEQYTLFVGTRLAKQGDLTSVAKAAKEAADRKSNDRIALYCDNNGQVFDLDLRGTVEEVLERLPHHPVLGEDPPPAPQKGPGRPKLGVVSKEVTLLPRHWQWLAKQRGGASATLRRLVEEARRLEADKLSRRDLQTALDRFLWDMASDFSGFEEATRALYAVNREAFVQQTESWPEDVRDYARRWFERMEHTDE